MVALTHDKALNVVIGNSRKAVVWNPLQLSLSELYEKLERPTRSIETIAEYLALPKSEQDERKDIGGFVGGRLSGPRRKAENVLDRCLVTLDFDTIPPYGTEKVLDALEAQGYGYCVYSTRKHRAAAPRLRIVIATDKPMTVDEYDAVSRKVAANLGIEMADPTTFEAHRLMYWPSCSSDSEYVFRYRDAPLLGVDAVLDSYKDWHDWAERPQVPGAVSYQKLAVRQGDPEAKPGIVGAFNRVCAQHGGIEYAMEQYIPGLYAPCDNDPNRYTYLNGSTTGGAVIYDNGKFLFSHHATDPCSNKLVNAADLVRLHKFTELDENTAPGTPINRMPSFKAFCEFAVADPEVSALMAQERYEQGAKEFEGVTGADGTTTAADDDPLTWIQKLSLTPQSGEVKPTIDNVLIILDNDPLLKGKFALNKFAGRGEILGALPWENAAERRLWSDTDTNGLYWYMEKVYKITKRGNIDAALDIHAANHAFNEVQEYIKRLSWDGTPRLDTLFIEYLGAEDNAYNRAVCRKSFTAAVARAMVPGCKYDNMLILCGKQGIGKSTILDKMSLGWFNDSIRTFEGKEASELLQGVWLVEVAELDAFSKSDVSRIKQFLSLRADRYRAAYGRNVKEYPRCCVFFGTINQSEFLQDSTGNRRFWPVDVGVQPSKKNVWRDLTDGEIAQIWAEAKARWQTGEQLYLTGDVEKQAQEMQERHRESDPLEGMIADFIRKPIPIDWDATVNGNYAWPLDRRRDWWANTAHGKVETVQRTYVCAAEIWAELRGQNPAALKDNIRASRAISAAFHVLGLQDGGRQRMGPYAVQRVFRVDTMGK